MPDPDARDLRIPIIEESVTIDKVTVQTDQVRVQTFVDERAVTVDEVVRRESLNVVRVAVDLPVAAAPPPREEGATTIISLVEERLVTEKRLFVVEEIYVTRTWTDERVVIPVTLRTMRATIEHPGGEPTGSITNG